MRKWVQNGILSVGAVCFTLAMIEVAGHVLARASPSSFGTLLGRELPPLKLPPLCEKPTSDSSTEPYWDLVVDGQRITVGDLFGILREDPVLGYGPREHAVSANGWWQSNNLGARARDDASAVPDAGKRRILVFGESFGAGTHIKQEQMWSAAMERALPGSEVLNFSVDGYSMAQAYLRFLQIRGRIRYDLAMVMFAPKADLPRDINVFRPLLSRDWELYTLLPRFVLADGRLVRVDRPPPNNREECDALGRQLRAHLAKYDRFYHGVEYDEGPPVVRYSVLYKLGVTAYANSSRRRIGEMMMQEGSEPFDVSSSIFSHMNADVMEDGGNFVLIFIPIEKEVQQLKSDRSYKARWSAMVRAMCGKALACIDLGQFLPELPQAQLDHGYDGTHYGPVTNSLIGEFIAHRLGDRVSLPGLWQIGAAQAVGAAGQRERGMER